MEERGIKRIEQPASPASGSQQRTLKFSRSLPLEPGENRLTVVAYNAAGLIASNPAEITVKREGAPPAARPRLYVLAVGVNEYMDGRLHLNFAVSDAKAIASAFEKAGQGLYEAVKVKTVVDGDVTRDHLGKVFTQLASEVRPVDVFVLFVAGHGRTKDGHYYFVPQDFRYRDENWYRTGISEDDLKTWTSTIQVNKSVLIYDTCESGSLTAEGAKTRGDDLSLIEEQAAAIKKLQRRVVQSSRRRVRGRLRWKVFAGTGCSATWCWRAWGRRPSTRVG